MGTRIKTATMNIQVMGFVLRAGLKVYIINWGNRTFTNLLDSIIRVHSCIEVITTVLKDNLSTTDASIQLDALHNYQKFQSFYR